MVVLTLGSSVTNGQSVSVAYSKSATGGQNLKDAQNNIVATFAAFAGSNGVGALPTLAKAYVSTAAATKVALEFSEPLTAGTPTAADFVVKVAGSSATISGAAYAAGVVELSLSAAVTFGQSVSAAYTKSASAGQNIKDAGTNAVATFAAAAVENQVGAPQPAATLYVDGLTNGPPRPP